MIVIGPYLRMRHGESDAQTDDHVRDFEARLEEAGSEDRAAWFTCALALAWPDGPAVVVEGRIDGTLTFPPRGDKGFGYDPMFVPDGYTLTFGEMDPAGKHAISHRAEAFRKLIAGCFSG